MGVGQTSGLVGERCENMKKNVKNKIILVRYKFFTFLD